MREAGEPSHRGLDGPDHTACRGWIVLRYVVADVLEVARGGLGPDDPHAEVVLGEDPVHLLIAHELAPIRRGDPCLDLGDLPGAKFDEILERLLHEHVSRLVGLPGELVNRTDRRRLDVKGHGISHGSPQALLNVGKAPRHFYRCTPIIAVRPPSTGSTAPVM